jgi:hypothetical protein
MRQSKERPLSARDIAEAISDTGEGQSLAFERVRHWAREGLLPLTGEKHPGTGRKRMFDASAFALARVLHEMAGYGIGVREPFFAAAAKVVRAYLARLKTCAFEAKDASVYLIIEIVGSNASARLDVQEKSAGEHRPKIDPDATSALVLNLSKLI